MKHLLLVFLLISSPTLAMHHSSDDEQIIFLLDLNIIEGMQEGRNSPAYNGGNFSPVLDNPTHKFNKWVANSLTDNEFSTT